MSAASLKIVVSTFVLSVAFLASVSMAKAETSTGAMQRLEKPNLNSKEAQEYMMKKGITAADLEKREAGMNKLEKTLNVDNLKEYQAKQRAEYEAKRKAVVEKRKSCLAQNTAYMKQKSLDISTSYTSCMKAITIKQQECKKNKDIRQPPYSDCEKEASGSAAARTTCLNLRKSAYLDARAQSLAMRKACVTTERAVLGLSTVIPFSGN